MRNTCPTARPRQPVVARCRCGWAVSLLFLAVLCACQPGVYHTVAPGQTLFRISRTYGVDSDYLARINNISDPTQLRAGTRLYIPGAERPQRVGGSQPRAAVPAPAVRQAAPEPSSVTSRPAPPRPSSSAASQPSSVAVSKASPAPQQTFHWPLRGRIVRQFSDTAQAGSGRGIEIASQAGSTIYAAEAGKVIYSGDGVSGYGFLVILQHDNELFTVYGFNQKNLVNHGAFVSRGEKIALSGTPPSGGEPRLHFEVRRGKEPVNPQLYLP